MPIVLENGDVIRKSKRAIVRHKCPMHKAVLQECVKRLTDVGFFSKSAVLESTGLMLAADSIRWDFIVDILTDESDEFKLALVPLAARFFHTRTSTRQGTSLESLGRFLAGGHGKKTAGYASVSLDNGRLALKKAINLAALRNGIADAWQDYVSKVQRQAQLTDQDRAILSKFDPHSRVLPQLPKSIVEDDAA